jgi:hypothetical protein
MNHYYCEDKARIVTITLNKGEIEDMERAMELNAEHGEETLTSMNFKSAMQSAQRLFATWEQEDADNVNPPSNPSDSQETVESDEGITRWVDMGQEVNEELTFVRLANTGVDDIELLDDEEMVDLGFDGIPESDILD